MIFRANNTNNPNATVMSKNSVTSSSTPALSSPTRSGLKLQTNLTTTNTTSAINMQQTTQPALIYSPPSPQSPHTMATKCGFSPNMTTQSCLVVDDKDAQIKALQGEIVSLKDVIKSRDAEITKLRREIHKLKVREFLFHF